MIILAILLMIPLTDSNGDYQGVRIRRSSRSSRSGQTVPTSPYKGMPPLTSADAQEFRH